MPEKKKTPEYTAKAIEKYHAKFDRIAVSLPKGSKEWIKKKTGKSCNAFFNDLFTEYKQRRETEKLSENPQEDIFVDYERRLAEDPDAMPFS